MKKHIIYFIVLSLLLFCSCQNDTVLDDLVEPRGKNNYELTNEEVITLLSGYLNVVQKENPATRGSSTVITHINKVRYDHPIKTRAGDVENNEFAICTVDLKKGDKDGFAIVVADKRMPVVLAYSPNGKFSSLKEKGSENLQAYVENIPANVKAALAQPRYLQGDFTDLNNRWKAFPYINNRDEIYSASLIDGSWEDVALLRESVLWGQGSPYNKLMPLNEITGEPMPVGCVNIALSQIMAYYRYPANYNWALMTQLVNIENNPFATPAMEEAICTFLKDLAVLTRTTFNYPNHSSGVTIPNCCNALDSLHYSYSTAIAYHLDSIRSSLKEKKFVIAFGQTDTGRGHAVTVSGYWKFTLPESMKNKDKQDGVNLGINWGAAGGWGDGWYLVEHGDWGIDILGFTPYNPSTGGNAGPNYNQNVSIVTNIAPQK